MSDGLDQPRLGLTPEPDEERREDVREEDWPTHPPEETQVEPQSEDEPEPEPEAEAEPDPELEREEEAPAEEDELPRPTAQQHAAGELRIPDGYGVIEGEPNGNRRAGRHHREHRVTRECADQHQEFADERRQSR